MTKRLAKKVLLIGWDAADWKVINPLMDAGKMPTLKKLVENGVMGNLATLDPPFSPMLWTSIATGKTADQHGIMGFTQPDAEKKRVRPVLSTTRKVKAIWNILTQNNIKSHVVGWWPSHPAEPINGVYVSNFYNKMGVPYPLPKLAKGTVHPESLEQTMAELRVHPAELTEAHLLPFVPGAADIDQDKDKRLYSLAKIIAEAATVHAAATWILENEEWEFMAVYYDAIDHFGHAFMDFNPPRREHVPENLYELYKGVIPGGYMYHDMMLNRLVQLAGDDCIIILVSDHGFHSDHLRPKGIPEEPAGPAVQHRPYGIINISGPGILNDELIFGSTLLDVAPTILSYFGLPAAKDMKGKVLLESFEHAPEPDYIESWEQVEGYCGMHDKSVRNDPYAEQQAMQQLINLGYVEPPTEDMQKNIDKSIEESQFYLARVYLYDHKYEQALPILEQLYKDHPDRKRYGVRLIECYHNLKRIEDGHRVLDELIEKSEKYLPVMDLYRAKLLIEQDKQDEALERLTKAEQEDASMPDIYLDMGHVYMKQRLWQKSGDVFRKALGIDNDNPRAHYGLGLSLYRQKQYEQAADELLIAVGLRFFFPEAHFFLGRALVKLGFHERAAEAFEVCVSQKPGIKRAHMLLVLIYKNYLYNYYKANEHLTFVREKIVKPFPVMKGVEK